MNRILRKLSAIWPFLVFLLVYIAIFYKVFLFGLFPFPGDLLVSWFFPYNSGGWEGYSSWITNKEFITADVVRQLFPWRALAIEAFKSGQIPLWNPYAFSGYPLLANMQSAVFYPINALFFIFENRAAWIIYILSQPILAFIFMYSFIRSIPLSKYAALFCGLSFGFIGYIAVWFEWGVVGHSALWLPLALFGITKYFKNSRAQFLLISSFALSCSIFAGHIQTTAYVGLITFLYYIFCAFSSKINHEKNIKTLLLNTWFLLLPLGITAIQILPSLELLQLSARNVPESLDIFHRFQLPYSHLLTIFAPDFFGNPAVGNLWKGNYAEFMGYFGIIALVFAVIGSIYQRKNKLVYFFLLLSFLALIFALPTPFSEALATLHIPVLDTSSPARTLFIFQFSFVVLSGFGIDGYLIGKKTVWKSLFLLVFIYMAMWAFTVVAPFFPQTASLAPFLSVIKRNLFIPTIILITTFVLIYIGTKNIKYKIFMFVCFLALLGFEYQYFLYKYSPFSPFKYFFPTHPLISYLQDKTPPHRIFGYDTTRIQTNLTTHWRLSSTEGYDSLYIKRYGELLNASYTKKQKMGLMRSDALLEESMPLKDSHVKRVLMDIMDVKYVLDKDDLAPTVWSPEYWKFPSDRFKLTYQLYKWKVYENKNAIPKATVFYDFAVEKDSKKIIETLFKKGFPYNKKLILEELPSNLPANKNLSPTPAKIILYQPNAIRIQTDIKAGGLLFLPDNYYPGWNAYVDGKMTKIFRANYTFKAISIKQGKHIVYLKYQPKSFIVGAIITTLSLFATCVIFLKLQKG